MEKQSKNEDKQFYSQYHKNKIFKNKFNKRSAILVHWRVQNKMLLWKNI